jgi:hypothetical protein
VSDFEKYRITLRCRPEEGTPLLPTSEDGSCVCLYTVYAANREDAVENAFAAHAEHCVQPCGKCEITAEAELVCDNVVD